MVQQRRDWRDRSNEKQKIEEMHCSLGWTSTRMDQGSFIGGEQMNAGDLVKCNEWVYDGRTGIVIKVQSQEYCTGAYVLLNIGLKLIRIENMTVLNEV